MPAVALRRLTTAPLAIEGAALGFSFSKYWVTFCARWVLVKRLAALLAAVFLAATFLAITSGAAAVLLLFLGAALARGSSALATTGLGAPNFKRTGLSPQISSKW